MRGRQGFTIIEMLGYLVALIVVLPLTGVLTVQLLKLERAVRPVGMSPALLETACLDLRRDPARGWHWTDGVLLAGGHRWEVTDGWLRRDGCNRFAVCTWRVARDGGSLLIELRPAHASDRRLILQEAP